MDTVEDEVSRGKDRGMGCCKRRIKMKEEALNKTGCTVQIYNEIVDPQYYNQSRIK